MLEISVQGDVKQLSRDMRAIQRRIPSLTAQAVNALATWARRETIRETAKTLKVPESKISGYVTRDSAGGKHRQPRYALKRAKPSLPVATLKVNGKAIDVSDSRYTWNRNRGGGVTAGGKFFRGAFVAQLNSGKRVIRRKGAARTPTESIWLFTRQELRDAFTSQVQGAKGTAYFRRKFQELGDRALARAGMR